KLDSEKATARVEALEHCLVFVLQYIGAIDDLHIGRGGIGDDGPSQRGNVVECLRRLGIGGWPRVEAVAKAFGLHDINELLQALEIAGTIVHGEDEFAVARKEDGVR